MDILRKGTVHFYVGADNILWIKWATRIDDTHTRGEKRIACEKMEVLGLERNQLLDEMHTLSPLSGSIIRKKHDRVETVTTEIESLIEIINS